MANDRKFSLQKSLIMLQRKLQHCQNIGKLDGPKKAMLEKTLHRIKGSRDFNWGIYRYISLSTIVIKNIILPVPIVILDKQKEKSCEHFFWKIIADTDFAATKP